MVVTLFWSKFREDLGEEGQADYREDAENMGQLAREFPGFRSIKKFTAEDGERLSVVVFDSMEQLDAWRKNPRHLEVQQRGRERFYREYRLMTCTPLREYGWSLEGGNRSG